ncbi:unnamed protein product [Rhizophagus irregularis]|nr:unnamed protein product [Rhizophagus irregularis]
MATEFSELDKDTNTTNTKNCSYCNIPFTEKLWCKECINSLEQLVENGDKEAMYNLAKCYENGEGTKKNLEKAFHWYQKAAEKDHVAAIFNLSGCYRYGVGTEKNLEKAFHWYQKAAEKDHVEAMNNLALCYENGEGTEKNLEKAFYWHKKVAECTKLSSKDEVKNSSSLNSKFFDEWKCVNKYYELNRDVNYIYGVPDIDNQLKKLKNNMLEFVKANEALVQEQANISIIQSHSQEYYTSRNVSKEIEKSKNVSESFVQEYSDLVECIVKI